MNVMHRCAYYALHYLDASSIRYVLTGRTFVVRPLNTYVAYERTSYIARCTVRCVLLLSLEA